VILEKTITAKNTAGLSEKELLAMIDQAKVPAHVAIIMDGNGRWAARRGLPRLLGHKKGMEVVKDIITVSSNLGIKALTLCIFVRELAQAPERGRSPDVPARPLSPEGDKDDDGEGDKV
jgi:undecaprenyl diphosphate synthase